MNEKLQDLKSKLEEVGYFTEESLLMSIYLSMSLQRPLFLEGEPGVGKTEVAKAMAKVMGSPLYRVQCYPGIDSNEVLYEWNYLKQILSIRLQESDLKRNGDAGELKESNLFSEQNLIPRPLLTAIRQEQPAVLLIDEIDRADERFEAFLLEYLAEMQISIPELGTVRASSRPVVILTSNRVREVHDALKRRCIYQWIDYPSIEREIAIVSAKAPELSEKLVRQMCAFVASTRKHDIDKKPGLSETLDWAEALKHLQLGNLFEEKVADTLGCLFKTREDLAWSKEHFEQIIKDAQALLSRIG